MLPPFERVIAEHGAAVWRACAAVVGPSDADDAWQETMIAALRAYPALDGDARVRAWLLTIAHRKAIDAVRARGRRGIPAEPEALGRAARATSPAADASSDVVLAPGEPTSSELWCQVGALPDAQRLAVAYHYLGGLTHAETGALLGRSPAAVRRAASDGVRALRLRLIKETP